ncbi:hypothetical protein BGZ92_000259 [Podila epicladia]|nr:hypothetical protein BGZ92_000259 [Podila epicladia]
MKYDDDDYEDALNVRKGLESTEGPARLQETIRLNLIDTPGLNSTGGDGLKDAIRGYVDMFPEFNGIFAFVHTHFDYKSFHPARAQVSHAIDLRTESLHEIMGRTTFPHFKIDRDVYNKKPIRDCITQNTIQKILELATSNQPVNMLQTVVNELAQIFCNETNVHRLGCG